MPDFDGDEEKKNSKRNSKWPTQKIEILIIFFKKKKIGTNYGVECSVVSKYSLDRVLTREFLHFDTRTRSYSSSFHKTSNGWGEF